MASYLKLIKIDTLLMIAFAQLALKYGLFEPFNIPITLNGIGIVFLILASVSLAAAGNIIIAIYNEKEENTFITGSITEKNANRLFIILNIIGVGFGFYLANLIGKPGFAAIFIIISVLFYSYASYLKEIIVVKNITIAVLAALSLVIVGVFDLLPAITDKNRGSQTVIFSIIIDYSMFAFSIIILKELVKDCLNINRDQKNELNTVPILLGKAKTCKLISLLTLFPIASVLYYIYSYLFANQTAVIVSLLLVVAPLLYFMIKIFNIQSNKELKRLRLLLKLLLIIVSFSLLFYQFIIL